MYHRSSIPFRYPESADTLSLVLRVPQHEGDVHSVEVVHFDPYEKKRYAGKATKVGSDSDFSYFSLSVTPEFKRIRYGFHLLDKSGKLLKSVTESGVHKEREIPNADSGLFCLPFIHKSDLNGSPAWAKRTVWYQIFPERFARGETTRVHPNQKEIAPWGSRQPSGATDFFRWKFRGGDAKSTIPQEPGREWRLFHTNIRRALKPQIRHC
jgi:hypothetical protein